MEVGGIDEEKEKQGEFFFLYVRSAEGERKDGRKSRRTQRLSVVRTDNTRQQLL